MIKMPIISEMFSMSRIIIIIIVILLTLCLISSIYTVKDDEIGILRTLGKITEITPPGIHFKLPYPMQQINVISILKSRTFKIGFKDSSSTDEKGNNYDYMMLTKDENLVWVDYSVEWKVTDPKAYLLNAKEPESILKNTSLYAITNAIGSSNIDSILGDGKTDVQNRTKQLLESTIVNYNIGIQIVEVKINDTQPPSQVSKSFKEVFDAVEQRKTLINKAEEYKNQKIPAAEGEAQKLKFESEAYYEERINQAKAEVAKFNSILKEYKASKSVTKTRLLMETLEEVLPGANIYIVDKNNNIIKALPYNETGGAN